MRGSATPETVVALAALVFVLTGGIDAARALGTAWGVERAASEAAWDVMVNGAGANPSAWTGYVQGVPLYAGQALSVQASPSQPSTWTYGTQVCVTAQAGWQAVSAFLGGMSRTFRATRCVYVQKWP